MKKILIIEDNTDLRELIKFNLEIEGYEVFGVDNANDGLIYLEDIEFNLIVLDLMLPGLDGIDFLKIIKSNDKFKNIPVIIISAKTGENDIVKGLEYGADDYLTKPFSIKVLIAKIKALFRRGNVIQFENKLKFKDIELDPSRFSIKTPTGEKKLSKKEFELLKILIENRGRVLTRNQLLDKVWGYSADVSTRTVDSHISMLRKKLGEYGKNLKSISKIGYILE